MTGPTISGPELEQAPAQQSPSPADVNAVERSSEGSGPESQRCTRRSHIDPYSGELGACFCDELLAKVVSHTRTSTDAGPDFCLECSQAISEWVAWPCDGSKRASGELGPATPRLEDLLDAHFIRSTLGSAAAWTCACGGRFEWSADAVAHQAAEIRRAGGGR